MVATFSNCDRRRCQRIMFKFFRKCLSKFSLNKMPFGNYDIASFVVDIFLRILLLCVFGIFQLMPPFKRIIQPEEVWLYKNPMTKSYFPMSVLWEIVIVIPSATIFANYIIHKDKSDTIQALLAFSLSVCLNGAITNVLKVVIGRPRPDFYYRCLPLGEEKLEIKNCTGDIDVINDGLKSFPSGHASTAFATLGFLSLYVAGKMHLFAPSGKGSTIKILVFLFPLVLAALIAISRTCDYHHHWQDVLCGSVLGFTICWLCYHNYYPPLHLEKCHMPWLSINRSPYAEPGSSIKEV